MAPGPVEWNESHFGERFGDFAFLLDGEIVPFEELANVLIHSIGEFSGFHERGGLVAIPEVSCSIDGAVAMAVFPIR